MPITVLPASAQHLPILSALELPVFDETLRTHRLPALTHDVTTTLQVNIGRRCNMACHHCHVESGPLRTENMDARVAQRVIELLAASPSVTTVDFTGGAPELNPHFKEMVREARRLGRRVIDRCNLTILFEPGQEDTAQFLADEGVDVVASLPCYSAENVEKQRGRGAFDKSITGLQMLNALGYGIDGSGLKLSLVYNPVGTSLPPAQADLERRYREELARLFGIQFNDLLTITNMPIKRFAQSLLRDGQLESYMSVLVNHFNPATVDGVMCRSLVSVAFDGALHDCDFNQMLELPLAAARTIWDVDSLDAITGSAITTAAHCFGCTAGAGSSCGGALQ